MRAYDIIYKKRNGARLTREEIDFFVGSYTRGEIPDYQASAFLMAAFIRGMDGKETALLTQAMCDSGDKMDLGAVPGMKVDKHSTGGVGDGVSLALAPLAAACGLTVPMISGRGLGHTGGTLDKLESIPGFRVNLSKDEFTSQLAKVGAAIMGQTAELAPADKKFYALRDVTATVDSIPLIAASIMSKKLAEGCDALVLDVKTGSGAFMQERAQSRSLARAMVEIGKRARKKMAAVITPMEQPLGSAIGNALEICQTIELLQGKNSKLTDDFVNVTDVLGGWMLYLAGKAKNPLDGKKQIGEARMNGRGLEKLREMISAQGGNAKVCDDPSGILPKSLKTREICAGTRGTVSAINARAAGMAALALGAGRETKESVLDLSAGIMLLKKTGDKVERGEPVAVFHFADENRFESAEQIFLAGLKIGKFAPGKQAAEFEVIR